MSLNMKGNDCFDIQLGKGYWCHTEKRWESGEKTQFYFKIFITFMSISFYSPKYLRPSRFYIKVVTVYALISTTSN